MDKQEFDSTAFYAGIRAKVIKYGKERIVNVRFADFEIKSIEDKVGFHYYLASIVEFIPPDDYYPCIKCGAIHHPKQNTLCER